MGHFFFFNPPPLWEFVPNFPIFFSDASPNQQQHQEKHQKQAVAELGQTQVKLEVVNDVVVKVRS